MQAQGCQERVQEHSPGAAAVGSLGGMGNTHTQAGLGFLTQTLHCKGRRCRHWQWLGRVVLDKNRHFWYCWSDLSVFWVFICLRLTSPLILIITFC